MSVRMPPHSDGSLSLTLGWFLPHRDFMGAEIGNRYASHAAAADEIAADEASKSRQLVADAEEAAMAVGGDSSLAAVDVRAWADFASILIGDRTSLPTWLGDALLNMLHHTRSTFWTADGRWRQVHS